MYSEKEQSRLDKYLKDSIDRYRRLHVLDEVAWSPNEGRQSFALTRTEKEVCYGGSRGGGKTDAGMAWMIEDIENPRFRGLVIRKNVDDLKDWVDRAKFMYRGTGVVVTGIPAVFTFPSGAKIITGHLKDENAYTKYMGHEYHKILIEELTHIPTEDLYMKLIASCRSTVPDLKPQVFCTTNPGEIGHRWVKRRFHIPDDPEGVLRGTAELKAGDVMPMTRFVEYVRGVKLTRMFIPSTIDNNPALRDGDPEYVAFLESIPDEELRMRWRYGSWADYDVRGAYWAMQLKQARKDRRIGLFPYDRELGNVHTAWDIGRRDSTAIIFFQVYGEKIRIIDYVQAEGMGLKQYVEILREKPYKYGRHYAPHDIRNQDWASEKQRRRIASDEYGIEFEIVDRISVQDSIDAVRHHFHRIEINEINCETLIDCIAHYRKKFDPLRDDYLPEPVHDKYSHGADALCYLILGWTLDDEDPAPATAEEILNHLNTNRQRIEALNALNTKKIEDLDDLEEEESDVENVAREIVGVNDYYNWN